MQKSNKIVIVGAGPGGLSAGMLLSAKGFDVEICEKAAVPGGRNSCINEKGFVFDTGPTFLMMKFVLDDIFKAAGRRSEDYLQFERLSPMYKLFFDKYSIDIFQERQKMRQELERVYGKKESNGLDKFIRREGQRYQRLFACLRKDYSHFYRFFEKDFLLSLPHLAAGRSLFSILGDYFKNPEARLCFTFQSKYLGMSPWQCPGAFAIIPFVEHEMGIYHVMGGLSKISEAMAKVVLENGGKIRYNAPVKSILTKGNVAEGVQLESGEKIYAKKTIINADFGYAMANLLGKNAPTKYSQDNLAQKKYSCSTFMIYLGLDKIYYNLGFHNIVFAKKYRKNVEDIFGGTMTENDFSLYMRNASVVDKTLAPAECSQLYILIPVPNRLLGGDINWQAQKNDIFNQAIKIISQRLGLNDIESHIIAKKIISPDEWEKDYNVYYGATFNLAHNLGQMLWFRPHNKLEGFENCFLAGGGTHPGSGLPTIYESGRISAELICRELLPERKTNLQTSKKLQPL